MHPMKIDTEKIAKYAKSNGQAKAAEKFGIDIADVKTACSTHRNATVSKTDSKAAKANKPTKANKPVGVSVEKQKKIASAKRTEENDNIMHEYILSLNNAVYGKSNYAKISDVPKPFRVKVRTDVNWNKTIYDVMMFKAKSKLITDCFAYVLSYYCPEGEITYDIWDDIGDINYSSLMDVVIAGK